MPSKWYEQTDNRGYPSKYAPGKYITGTQYLIELLCERKAHLDQQTLPIYFWRNEKWEIEFKAQTRCINSLLKKYDLRALVHVLHTNPKVYSLRAAFVKPKIEAAQKLVEADKERFLRMIKENQHTTINRDTVNTKTRSRVIKKNALSQLYELDEVENGESKEEC